MEEINSHIDAPCAPHGDTNGATLEKTINQRIDETLSKLSDGWQKLTKDLWKLGIDTIILNPNHSNCRTHSDPWSRQEVDLPACERIASQYQELLNEAIRLVLSFILDRNHQIVSGEMQKNLTGHCTQLDNLIEQTNAYFNTSTHDDIEIIGGFYTIARQYQMLLESIMADIDSLLISVLVM